MGKGCCRRYAAFLFLQEQMQNCYRQQEKRRVATHWIEQCQRKYMIHWIGQCQSRSAEHTGFEALSKGVHSHCLVKPTAVSSASVPPSTGCQDGYDCSRQCLSVVYTVSDTLSEGFISLLPPFLVPFSQYRCYLAHHHAHSRVRRPPPHSRCFSTLPLHPQSLLPLPTLVASSDPRCTPTQLLPPHTAAASPRRRCLPPPLPPPHPQSKAAADPPQHPPPATDGPPSGRPHPRRSRCHRPPAGAAAPVVGAATKGGGGGSDGGDGSG